MLTPYEQKVEETCAVAHHVWRCDDCQLHQVERGWRSWAYEDCPECGHHGTRHATSPPAHLRAEGLRVLRECRSKCPSAAPTASAFRARCAPPASGGFAAAARGSIGGGLGWLR